MTDINSQDRDLLADILYKLIKENIQMSAAIDRLKAAVDANSTKVDQLLAQGSADDGSKAALAEAEAAMNDQSVAIEATNAKIDGKIAGPFQAGAGAGVNG